MPKVPFVGAPLACAPRIWFRRLFVENKKAIQEIEEVGGLPRAELPKENGCEAFPPLI